MVLPMAPDVYVAEDGLAGHQWEEALGPEKDRCCSVGECQGREAGEGGGVSTLIEAGEEGIG